MPQKNVVQPNQKFTNTDLTLSGGNSKPKVSIKNSKSAIEKRFAAKTFEKKYEQSCALEKLSYDLLDLCGLKVPKTYIMHDDSSSILLSRIEPGYKNFLDLVGGECNAENNTFKFDKDALTRSAQTQSISFNNKNKPIIGLFENVAIFMFLGDRDTIGTSLQNVGLIEHEYHFQAIKIDPGFSHIKPTSTDKIEHGFKQYITGLYDLYTTNTTEFFYWGDRGNNTLVFSNCTSVQVLDGIHRVSNLTDTQLYEVIHNEKIPFLNSKERQGIYQLLINRRDTFRVFLKEIKKPNFDLENFLKIHVKPQPVIEDQPNEEIIRPSTTTDNDYQQLQFLKAAVNRAVINYHGWFDGDETKNRGHSNGFFTWARHGKKGRINATNFNALINQEVSLDSAITFIKDYLTAPSTRFHTHSLTSYLLDELKHSESWPIKNIAFDETSKRYEQETILSMN